MTLPAINAPLDALVEPLVLALRRDGFPTFASCDGKRAPMGDAGHPWVNIDCDESYPIVYSLQQRLLEWMERHGLMGNVCCIETTANGERWRFIRIEVYSDLHEATF